MQPWLMERGTDRTAEVVPATLEHEMQLIDEAIALVASGRAPRTVVANLRLGDSLLEPARRKAAAAGVTIRPLWTGDEHGLDFAIEPAPADGEAL
jgi:hypothetical protein